MYDSNETHTHSVISKLDIPEWEDTDLVVQMYIDDVIKESAEASGEAEEMSKNKQKAATRLVRMWLIKDGYLQPSEFEAGVLVKQEKKSSSTTTKSSTTKPSSKSSTTTTSESKKQPNSNDDRDKNDDNDGDDETDDLFGCAASLFES